MAAGKPVIRTPLQLPRLSRDEMALRNLISRHRRPIEFEWLGATWTFGLTRGGETVPGPFRIDANWGGARVLVTASGGWVEEVIRALVPEATLSSLPEPLMLAILESAFASVSDLIGTTTRKLFRVENAGFEERDLTGMTRFGFHMERKGETVSGDLWFDALGMGFLAAALRSIRIEPAGDENWLDLQLPLRVELGWTSLDAAVLRDLAVHDVVLLDECWLTQEDEIRVRVGRTRAFGAALKGTQMTVTTELEETMMDEDDGDLEHDDVSEDDGTGDGGFGGDFGDVPVRLAFDVGERTITLADLREIGPGHTFDMGRDLRRAVTIRANGMVIGEGELVEIDGRIGVSVLELSRSRHSPE